MLVSAINSNVERSGRIFSITIVFPGLWDGNMCFLQSHLLGWGATTWTLPVENEKGMSMCFYLFFHAHILYTRACTSFGITHCYPLLPFSPPKWNLLITPPPAFMFLCVAHYQHERGVRLIIWARVTYQWLHYWGLQFLLQSSPLSVSNTDFPEMGRLLKPSPPITEGWRTQSTAGLAQ